MSSKELICNCCGESLEEAETVVETGLGELYRLECFKEFEDGSGENTLCMSGDFCFGVIKDGVFQTLKS